METGVLALGLTFALLLAAVWMFLDARSAQEQVKMPAGDVVYADMGQWHEQGEQLFAEDVGLVGKPDYLIRQPDGGLVPVEVKSGRTPEHPYNSHVMQVAAYCLLVEENYGIRPKIALIQYPEGAFEVDFTYELEDQLLDILAEMREDMFANNIHRSHDKIGMCRACGVKDFCDQRLG